MRKIAVEKWTAKDKDGGNMEDSLLTVLNAVISSRPDDLPRGIENFNLFSRLSKAFSKAGETGVLELEEVDYSMLKGIIDRGVPSFWAMNPNINKVISEFVSLKEE